MIDEQKERINFSDELHLIRAVLEGYKPSIARDDALCAVWGLIAQTEIAEADRRDAERYREIRRINMKNDPCFSGMTEEEFDANTDAAIKESK
ncbi:MAG: hypothetical protein KGL39_39345 [Patescibacteria group bacterium]|nr:hypothetical protein [Patescibacteria group bacterium]